MTAKTPEYLTIKEVATWYGRSIGTIRRWIAQGRIPYDQPHGKCGWVLVRRQDLERVEKNGR